MYQKMPNKRLKRTNIRCHLFCKETQKSRHQTFARLAGRYMPILKWSLQMRKVVVFEKVKHWLLGGVDLELLNEQITEMEKDGWNLVSVTANTHLFGGICSFNLLIESVDN
jgi:hypothetical protein